MALVVGVVVCCSTELLQSTLLLVGPVLCVGSVVVSKRTTGDITLGLMSCLIGPTLSKEFFLLVLSRV